MNKAISIFKMLSDTAIRLIGDIIAFHIMLPIFAIMLNELDFHEDV